MKDKEKRAILLSPASLVVSSFHVWSLPINGAWLAGLLVSLALIASAIIGELFSAIAAS